jgi:hypothetical protein
MIAEAAHHEQMFNPPKGPILLAMSHDPFREDGTDPRQLFQFAGWSLVDVDQV